MTEVVPAQIWTLDQLQGIVNINVPVRTTIIKLKAGGLWLHNPVAPTPECLELVASLEREHGRVKYIVLSTVALEHKATAGPFSQFFPQAEVWLQPGQWSFPVQLPMEDFGFRGTIDAPYAARPLYTLPKRSEDTPWSDEIEQAMLGTFKFKAVGAYGETAFFHKLTRTLLVTDTVVKVGREPPEIVAEDPRPLLFHARNSATDIVTDTPEARRRGWRRMCQFGLCFFPASIQVSSVGQALDDIGRVPDGMRPLSAGAVPLDLYPWVWGDDTQNFEVLTGGVFVPPILQKLILNREAEATLAWADRVSEWPFQRIIPGHLENDIQVTPQEFRKAFTFLETGAAQGVGPTEADFKLLTNASKILTDLGVIAPPSPPRTA